MNKMKQPLLFVLPGIVYCGIVYAVLQILPRIAGQCIPLFAPLLGVNGTTAEYISEILSQWSLADIRVPVFLLTVVFAAVIWIWYLCRKTKRMRILRAMILVLLFLPVSVLAVLHTEINGVRMTELFRILGPIVTALV